MAKVTEIFEDLKDITELKVFAEAQTNTIIDLNKKINQLQVENEHLKKLLESSIPVISNIAENVDDEETIARTQLNRLRNVSMERELTYEETKKVDIYAKLLIQLQEKGKQKTNPAEKYSTEDLLQLVEENGSEAN